MARTKSHQTRDRARQLNSWLIAVLGFVCLCTSVPAPAQSGRRNEPGKPTKSKPGPIADPDRPGTSSSPNRPARTTDEVDENDVVRISSNLVPIPVSVVDKRGNAVLNLKLDDFELHVDGELRPLSDFTRSETSVRLAMLFDNSGSLDPARDFEKQAAIRFFRKVLRSKDEAAIYSIDTDSYLAQSLTNDIVRLEHTIAVFGKPEGGTSLFDAIVKAATYLRPYSGRKVVVIVSDGIETTSKITDFDQVVQHVLADDCQVYVVQTGLYEGANLRALAAERRMEQLSGQTGGAVYLPKTTDQLDVAFSQIAADLAQQYVLSYYPSADQRDGQLHKLDLRIKSRNDVRVRSRKGYYAPKPAPSARY
ncbi:MAG TPA: VWA domain-containing protein [Pyrinomonadaceae bacterium]|nr:VWA domain-containing protein [Pyrinomonadaceae bacterium]